LVGSPYTLDGQVHPYGHAAIRVVTPTTDTTYDYGRYGKTWGPFSSEGEGILRIWSNFAKYIKEENDLGRTTTGYRFSVTQQQAEAVSKHLSNMLGDIPTAIHVEESHSMRVYHIKDYTALESNCTTLSVLAAEQAIPTLQSEASPFNTGRGLSNAEKAAAHVSDGQASCLCLRIFKNI
jgi:hypothetical protein